MQTALLTYRDVLDHVLDVFGADATVQMERKARRAIQNAISDFWSKRNWSCFYKRGRILTNSPYSTGTVSYQGTGGAVDRQLTLTGGTWPDWASDGAVKVGTVVYPIWARISNTVVQLQMATAKLDDFADSPYTLFQESYTLPVDFSACDELYIVGIGTLMQYLPPGEYLRNQRIHVGPAVPHIYTFMGDPRRYGTLSAFFYPPPLTEYTIDYSYRRQSRALSMHGATPVVAYTTGKVNCTVGGGQLVVSGIGTAFTTDMVGAVIRFAGTANGAVPTGQGGASPFFAQRIVSTYTNGSTIGIDQPIGTDLLGVPFSISDPIDLESGAMSTYFLRECEKQARMIFRTEPLKSEEREYLAALNSALEADSRHYEARSTFGQGGLSRTRIANMPVGSPIGG